MKVEVCYLKPRDMNLVYGLSYPFKPLISGVTLCNIVNLTCRTMLTLLWSLRVFVLQLTFFALYFQTCDTLNKIHFISLSFWLTLSLTGNTLLYSHTEDPTSTVTKNKIHDQCVNTRNVFKESNMWLVCIGKTYKVK